MRIFTCTPVEFDGGPDFFARDSGLVCRGLQASGVESRAVMPGGPHEEDQADLIRTEFKNLESADWWRSMQLDGVVLYAWGRPRFRKVAKAIQDAGVFLILNQDNSGLISPLASFDDWLREQWLLSGTGRNTAAITRFFKLTLRGLTAGIILTDTLRASHLKHGNLIACVSPKATKRYQTLCQIYGGKSLSKRVITIPHAVESEFSYSGELKQRRVVCVGRWQDVVQKRPWLMTQVISILLKSDPILQIEIIGTVTSELQSWHHALDESQSRRVILHGIIDHRQLVKLLSKSQVFYSPSAFESFGIAAAEALCSGCSIVAERLVSMPAFDWFISERSGSLANDSKPSTHVELILYELDQWKRNERNAATIADTWGERFHEKNVASTVMKMIESEDTR